MVDELPSSAPAREPGAPIAEAELDPELIALRATNASISPVLAIAILVFCGYLMFILRHDIRFSRQPATPARIDSVHALTDPALNNQFVAVHAVPDRTFVANVSTGRSTANGQRFTPFLGTDDHIWLLSDSSPWTASIAYEERYIGRIRALAALPFADQARSYIAQQPPTPRLVDITAVKAALIDNADELIDTSGSVLSVAPAAVVMVTETVPGRAQLIARATWERRDEAAWNLALSAASILPTSQRPYRSNEYAIWYDVPAPTGLDHLRQQLVAARLYSVHVAEVTRMTSTMWSSLASTVGGLRVGDTLIPSDTVSRITVSAKRTLPNDAVVLLTNESPDAYWYLLPIYISLTLTALVFSWALMRTLQRKRLDASRRFPSLPDA